MLKQEQIKKRRYYERFQVEDVINFFSGQLLQAKTSDGAQVFLQSIKVSRRPLPAGYQDTLRKLQHPHLAPILDVMEEEDQIILVHPPFSGDPLPLIVNKDHPMEPEKAVRMTIKLLRTIKELERLPLPLGATLDPKNILLNSQKPLLLFYYYKDQENPIYDEKWRELLYYLVVGQTPTGGSKQAEKILEAKQIPTKIIKLVLTCLDRKITYSQILEVLERYVANEKVDPKLSRGTTKKKHRKAIYATVSIAVAALVLITFAVYQDPGDSNANPFKVQDQHVGSKEFKPDDSQEVFQTINFGKDITSFTLPARVSGPSNIRGEFKINKLDSFIGLLETVDKSATYGLMVDKKGRMVLFEKNHDKTIRLGDSGSRFRVEAGQKYTFEINYFPGEPLRVSIFESDKVDKWMAVATSPVNSEMRIRFFGGDGDVLFTPEVTEVTDRKQIDEVWMNQQPWRIDVGQGILSIDSVTQSTNLFVYPRTRISMNLAASPRITLAPSYSPLNMEIQAIDGTRFRLIWENKNKFTLYQFDESLKKVKEQVLKWTPDNKKPITFTFSSNFNKLSVDLTDGTNKDKIEYQRLEPISLNQLFLYSDQPFVVQSNVANQNQAKK